MTNRLLIASSFIFALVAIIGVQLSNFKLSTAENTVGRACYNDSECSLNEVCEEVSWLSPPCRSGVCQCASCFTIGTVNYSSPDFANNTCAPIWPLIIGENCTSAYNEVILPDNAECSSLGTVQCKEGFIEVDTYNGTTCIHYDGGLPQGEDCDYDDECAGDMICSWDDNTCQCPSVYQIYDGLVTGKCVKRQYGDACDNDADCQVYGGNWDGYSWTTGACSANGSCGCQSGTRKTIASYVNPTTGSIASKEICVALFGTVNLGNYSVCNVDPIRDSNLKNVKVCGTNLTCFACPEDGSFTLGRCRSVVSPNPAPQCFVKPPPILQTSSTTTTTTTTTPTPFAGWSQIDLMISRVVNLTYPNVRNLRGCTTSADCKKYESCLMPSQCGHGFCHCVPPAYVDYFGNCYRESNPTSATVKSSIRTYVYVKPTPSTRFPPRKTTTTASTISTRSTRSTTTSTPYYNVTEVPPAYGMPCTTTADCAVIGLGTPRATVVGSVVMNDLVCQSQGSDLQGTYCICNSKTYTWSASTAKCRLKDYGDPCTKDSECDNGLYTKQGVSGIRCDDDGTCSCALNYTAVFFKGIAASWGSNVPSYITGPQVNRTYCVNSNLLTTDLGVGENCTANILDQSDSATSVCKTSLVCLTCPLDALQSPAIMGTCVNFVYPGTWYGSPTAQKSEGHSNVKTRRYALATALLLVSLLIVDSFSR